MHCGGGGSSKVAEVILSLFVCSDKELSMKEQAQTNCSNDINL